MASTDFDTDQHILTKNDCFRMKAVVLCANFELFRSNPGGYALFSRRCLAPDDSIKIQVLFLVSNI